MRRTGVVLAAMSAALLGLPAGAGADAAPAAVACAVRTLPVPGGGGVASAIVNRDAFLGYTDLEHGYLWRDGVTSPVPIRAEAVNSSGLVLGSRLSSSSWSQAARVRLGDTTPDLAGQDTYAADINDDGVAVLSYFAVGGLPGLVARAMWWKPGDAAPARLPAPPASGVSAIDDLGYMVGFGEGGSDDPGRRALAWGPDGTTVLQLGPFGPSETVIGFDDIDDGVAAGGRYPSTGTKDIVLVDVRTGTVTPVAATAGYNADRYEDGALLGHDVELGYALWKGGQRYELTELADTERMSVTDMRVFGTTVVLTGHSQSYPGYHSTPVVWECG